MIFTGMGCSLGSWPCRHSKQRMRVYLKCSVGECRQGLRCNTSGRADSGKCRQSQMRDIVQEIVRRSLRRGLALLLRTAGMLIAFAIGAASVVPASAQAPYPSRPIHILVPFGPGGFADITVRLLAQKLTERTNAEVVIENRPGAGGITAGHAVASAEPDGYTLFVFSSGIALSKSLLKSMPFDPVTAFTPIST